MSAMDEIYSLLVTIDYPDTPVERYVRNVEVEGSSPITSTHEAAGHGPYESSARYLRRAESAISPRESRGALLKGGRHALVDGRQQRAVDIAGHSKSTSGRAAA